MGRAASRKDTARSGRGWIGHAGGQRRAAQAEPVGGKKHRRPGIAHDWSSASAPAGAGPGDPVAGRANADRCRTAKCTPATARSAPTWSAWLYVIDERPRPCTPTTARRCCARSTSQGRAIVFVVSTTGDDARAGMLGDVGGAERTRRRDPVQRPARGCVRAASPPTLSVRTATVVLRTPPRKRMDGTAGISEQRHGSTRDPLACQPRPASRAGKSSWSARRWWNGRRALGRAEVEMPTTRNCRQVARSPAPLKRARATDGGEGRPKRSAAPRSKMGPTRLCTNAKAVPATRAARAKRSMTAFRSTSPGPLRDLRGRGSQRRTAVHAQLTHRARLPGARYKAATLQVQWTQRN